MRTCSKVRKQIKRDLTGQIQDNPNIKSNKDNIMKVLYDTQIYIKMVKMINSVTFYHNKNKQQTINYKHKNTKTMGSFKSR